MCNEKNEGLKFDKGKPMFALVPFSIIEKVIEPRILLNFNEKKALRQAYKYQSEPTVENLNELLNNMLDIVNVGQSETSRLEGVAKVYEFGMQKYGYLNWTLFEPTTTNHLRFLSAFFRHFFRYIDNHESVDEESGLNHIHHAIWNVIMLIYLTEENENK